MLRRLTPRVERLCSVAEVAGVNRPAAPKVMRLPFNLILLKRLLVLEGHFGQSGISPRGFEHGVSVDYSGT